MNWDTALEKDIASYCIQALQYAGWYCRQVENKKFVKSGFSDWVIIRRGVVIFIEFKSKTGKQRPEQVEFMKEVLRHGGDYRVVRNLDQIMDLLGRGWTGGNLNRQASQAE